MNEFIEKLIGRLEEISVENTCSDCPYKAKCDEVQEHINDETTDLCGATIKALSIEIVNQLAEEYINCSTDTSTNTSSGWIPCSERLPERENKYGWVSCIVSVIRTHYPTSTYDICDSPYDENIVMHANYDVSQKIWHLECDEQLNALIGIEDAPLNSDYVIAWMPLPEPFTPKEGRE